MSDSHKVGQLTAAVDDDFLLDDIEDMPGFVTPPTGAYSVCLEKGIEVKDINNSSYYEVAMTIKELLEVQEKNLEDGESMPKIGDIASMIFKRDNEFGMSNFKKFARSIAEKFGVKSIGDIRNASKGLDMIVVIKRKYDKKADVHRTEITKAQVI
jgi:hypothetical protein